MRSKAKKATPPAAEQLAPPPVAPGKTRVILEVNPAPNAPLVAGVRYYWFLGTRWKKGVYQLEVDAKQLADLRTNNPERLRLLDEHGVPMKQAKGRPPTLEEESPWHSL